MKKVLVLATAVALFAAPAFAAITTTKHDLSSTNTVTFKGSSGEICVYCHTPHAANLGVTLAPLWNRTSVNATSAYGGLAIQATYDLTSINATDAPLCLSCHDGASLTQSLQNAPNTTGQPTFAGGNITNDAAPGVYFGNIGTALNNDHPIGFDFSVINGGGDTEIKTKAAAIASGAKFFGTGNNFMWCSSCHDVHNTANQSPFLNVSNAGSGLCLACHIK